MIDTLDMNSEGDKLDYSRFGMWLTGRLTGISAFAYPVGKYCTCVHTVRVYVLYACTCCTCVHTVLAVRVYVLCLCVCAYLRSTQTQTIDIKVRYMQL